MAQENGFRYKWVIIGADGEAGQLPPQAQSRINDAYTRLIAGRIHAYAEANYPAHQRRAVYISIVDALP